MRVLALSPPSVPAVYGAAVSPPLKWGDVEMFQPSKGRKGPWMNLEDIVLSGRS